MNMQQSAFRGLNFACRRVAVITLFFVFTPLSFGQCDMRAEADRYLRSLLPSNRIHGAAFVYIHGAHSDESFYGDGVSGETLWRAASVSKALTATAIVQLAEARKLSLDTDVRLMLPPNAIRNPFRSPVTVRQLLLHRGGVDDRFIGDGFIAGEQPSMTEIMSIRPLDVVYEPGRIESYSNYGYALLGAVIERASGERYEQYMREHVLEPLHMDQSSFEQPLPASWRSQMVPGKWVYQRSVPAASLTTSAADIRQLLAAMLNRGSPLVSPTSFEQMAPPTEPDVKLARGFGFWTGNEHGHRLVAATGDIEDFHSMVAAFPDLQLGFAILISGKNNALTTNLFRVLVDHCVAPSPGSAPKPEPIVAGATAKADFAGLYRTVRYPHNELSKIFILSDLTRVLQQNDGSLKINDEKYVPSGSSAQFRPLAGGAPVSFLATKDGRHFLNRLDAPTLERIHWWETGWTAVVGYFAAVGLCVVAVTTSRGLTRLLCTIPLVYAIGWLASVVIVGPSNLILGMPFLLKCFLLLAYSLPLLFALSLATAFRSRSKLLLALPLAIVLLGGIAYYWHVYWP